MCTDIVRIVYKIINCSGRYFRYRFGEPIFSINSEIIFSFKLLQNNLNMTINILVRKIDSLGDRCNVCGYYKVICRFTSISIGFSFKFLQRCLNANNLNAPVVWFSLFLISCNVHIVDNYRPPEQTRN